MTRHQIITARRAYCAGAPIRNIALGLRVSEIAVESALFTHIEDKPGRFFVVAAG